ncbi:MAG: GNAT family N-acetyltransferase [Micrococcaceae bacterium]|nr:GNAT family N-acetyltransferase [Micrococcaceae bacterium]MDN6201605.1 GNAT family N-acetyltransferase [Micrococcaceae bacterium]
MAYTIRRPAAADAPALAGLHVATWQQTYEHLLPEGFFTEEHRRKRQGMWEHILGQEREDFEVRLAEQDGEPLGFAFSGPSVPTAKSVPPRERQLFCLYVLQSGHGTGVGQDLFNGVLGEEAAMLWVEPGNPRAISFYRRNGFEFDGTE